MPLTYLDWAATAPTSTEILDETVRAALAYPGNPSSLHAAGKAAREALEAARGRLAACLGCRSERLFFTSGGTEADSIILLSLLRRRNPGTLVISSIEHAAVHAQAAVLESLGWKVRRVAPEADGIVPAQRIADACDEDTVLVALMAVNNETGALQPLAETRALLDRASKAGRRIGLHSDAVQAFGKIPFEPETLGLDSAAFSAHKVRGPRGAGALYLRAPLDPAANGGGQESGIRPGTENLPGILGFVRAAEISARDLPKEAAAAGARSDRLIANLRDIPGARPIPECRGAGDGRYSPWILSLALPGLPGETAVRALSDSGFAISTGSACSSSRRKRRILEAMGVPEDIAFSTIRFSQGPTTSLEEIDAFSQVLREVYLRYRT